MHTAAEAYFSPTLLILELWFAMVLLVLYSQYISRALLGM